MNCHQQNQKGYPQDNSNHESGTVTFEMVLFWMFVGCLLGLLLTIMFTQLRKYLYIEWFTQVSIIKISLYSIIRLFKASYCFSSFSFAFYGKIKNKTIVLLKTKNSGIDSDLAYAVPFWFEQYAGISL